MEFLDGLKAYAGSWIESNRFDLDKKEVANVKSASVVKSQYNNSVCFVMKDGTQRFIPVSNTSDLEVGDSIDLKEAITIIELERDGETINRVEASAK